jgi:hypothetical protein
MSEETDDILAQAASAWAEIEQHLIKTCGLVSDITLERERAHCISIIIEAIRGDRVIDVPQLELATPVPMPQIDRKPVSWWKNHAAHLDDSLPPEPPLNRRQTLEAYLTRPPTPDEQARWDSYLDQAVHGYDGDDEVNYRRK